VAKLGKVPTTVENRAGLFLALSIAVTLLLFWVPYGPTIGYPLTLLSALVHELGHGISAWLVGGRFHAFEMWPDGSGAAQVSTSGGRIARAIVAAGGLCGPAVAAAAGFVLARRPGHARLALGAAGVLLLLADLIVVRNGFGWAFVTALAATLLLLAFRASAWASQLALVFLSVQLALSVFSRADYLFTPVARTGGGGMPSDVANMASALFLPYWFWGALCAAFSVAALAVGAWLFLRAVARDAGRRGALPR
jgi:hypothetical protein